MTLVHKYWKTAALSASGHVGDNPLFLLDYLLLLLRVGVLLAQATVASRVIDVETHRLSFDEVIADIYAHWQVRGEEDVC